MVKRSSFMTQLSLFLFHLIISALQLESSVIKKTLYADRYGMRNWSDAQQYCKEKYTDIAYGEDLLYAFTSLAAPWIGLYRDPGEFVWRWTGERRDASNDTNWATGEAEMKNCTRVNVMWRTSKCSETYPSYCSDGKRIVYELRRLSWHDAQQSCENKSMVLATVTQSNKNNFTTNGGWIGLHMPPPNAPGKSQNTWQWIGRDSDFRDWAPEQPDLNNCGYRHRSSKWHSSRCSIERRFICVDYDVILVKENKTWEEALEHCRAIDGVDSSRHNHYRDHRYDLVSLQSEDDHRYARHKIQEATTNEVWTALRFLAGQWLWVDGEPQRYQNLPPCLAQWRHCGTLPKDPSTQWQIRDCMERRNFLCIKSPGK